MRMWKILQFFKSNWVCCFSGIVALVFSGCAVSPTPSNPLVGKIVRASDQTEISENEIHALVASADVVYLGEIHDNPWHHEIQLEIVRHLVEASTQPAIGFEFFDTGQTSDLMSFIFQPDMSGDHAIKSSAKAEQRLRRRLGWGKERDDEWAAYFPIIDYARQNGLAVFGTDLPRGLKRRLARADRSQLSPIEQRFIVDTGFNNDAYRTLMQDTFNEMHCGWSDQKLLDRLYQTWLARNDAMATAITDMLAAGTNRPIIMIVGAGHTRYNMGIYERVAALASDARQVNIGLKPVQNASKPLADYFQTETIGDTIFAPVHEYLWFTKALKREDPCLEFKHQLKQPPIPQGE